LIRRFTLLGPVASSVSTANRTAFIVASTSPGRFTSFPLADKAVATLDEVTCGVTEAWQRRVAGFSRPHLVVATHAEPTRLITTSSAGRFARFILVDDAIAAPNPPATGGTNAGLGWVALLTLFDVAVAAQNETAIERAVLTAVTLFTRVCNSVATTRGATIRTTRVHALVVVERSIVTHLPVFDFPISAPQCWLVRSTGSFRRVRTGTRSNRH
jgi:hypothetical protein